MKNKGSSLNYRIFEYMQALKRTDTSFTEKRPSGLAGLFWRTPTYSQHQVRDIWFMAIEVGLEKGFHMSTIEGQKVDVNSMTNNQREFYEKFLNLCQEYNCAIQYNLHEGGQVIVDLNKKQFT